ncbi:hypothetical protein Droror1_Dr00015671 [Drosera rotundifolia]
MNLILVLSHKRLLLTLINQNLSPYSLTLSLRHTSASSQNPCSILPPLSRISLGFRVRVFVGRSGDVRGVKLVGDVWSSVCRLGLIERKLSELESIDSKCKVEVKTGAVVLGVPYLVRDWLVGSSF